MATTVLNGKDYILEIDEVTAITAPRGSNASYKPILCEVSSTFGIATDEQSVSNKCGGGWANSNPGDSSFTFSSYRPYYGRCFGCIFSEYRELGGN